MSEIHNNKKRMPVVLKSQDHQAWLTGNEVSGFSFPYDVDLEANPVQGKNNLEWTLFPHPSLRNLPHSIFLDQLKGLGIIFKISTEFNPCGFIIQRFVQQLEI